MQRLLIVGAGGHGRSVAEAVLAAGVFRLAGFADDASPGLQQIAGFPVLGTTAGLASSACGGSHCGGWQQPSA